MRAPLNFFFFCCISVFLVVLWPPPLPFSPSSSLPSYQLAFHAHFRAHIRTFRQRATRRNLRSKIPLSRCGKFQHTWEDRRDGGGPGAHPATLFPPPPATTHTDTHVHFTEKQTCSGCTRGTKKKWKWGRKMSKKKKCTLVCQGNAVPPITDRHLNSFDTCSFLGQRYYDFIYMETEGRRIFLNRSKLRKMHSATFNTHKCHRAQGGILLSIQNFNLN